MSVNRTLTSLFCSRSSVFLIDLRRFGADPLALLITRRFALETAPRWSIVVSGQGSAWPDRRISMKTIQTQLQRMTQTDQNGRQFFFVPWCCQYTRGGNLFAWIRLPGDYSLSTFGADTDEVEVGKLCGISLCRLMTDEEAWQAEEDRAIDWYCSSEADYTNWAE
jgi:hypothetical protein